MRPFITFEPRHRTSFLDTMWQLGKAIQQHRYVHITYGRLKDRKVVERRLKPLALLFSEYYFYLIAFIETAISKKSMKALANITPTIYRLDRIKTLSVNQKVSAFLIINVFRKANSESASSSCTAGT